MYPGKSGYHVINSITGSLGSPNIKVLNLHFSGKNVGLSKHVGTRSWRRQSLQYTGLVTSRQADRLLASSNDPASEIKGNFFYSFIFYIFFVI